MSNTERNLEAAFGGESMANRKYLFFSQLCMKLGYRDIGKLFREIADQETEHAFAHFRVMHPELDPADPKSLTEDEKKELVAKCLELAIEGETYEFVTMYPEFKEQAIQDKDSFAEKEFTEQIDESKEHALIFSKAGHKFGLLESIEKHHARRYEDELNKVLGKDALPKEAPETDPAKQKYICIRSSMIYDPVKGDPDSGIAPGTTFAEVPDDWSCPICHVNKKAFVPLEEYSDMYKSLFEKKLLEN